MRIYISLPITGVENEAREHADLIKASLSRLGYTPVSPFDIYAGKNPSYIDYLCADIKELVKCDAVMFCKGWQFSRGCRIERAFAQEFRKKIMFESSRTN